MSALSYISCTFPDFRVHETSAGGVPNLGGAGSDAGGAARAGATSGGSGGSAQAGVAGQALGGSASASCTDQMMNGDETGVDCGGSCPACAPVPCSQLGVAVDPQKVVGRDALVGWYRFFDADQLGADASGSGNSALSVTKLAQGRDSTKGCIADFEGDADMVLPPLVTASFTLSLWIRTKVDGRGALGDPWHVGSGLVDGEHVDIVNDFGLCLVASQVAFGVGNPDLTIGSPTAVDDDVWHQVTATRDNTSGEMKLFIDGVVAAQAIGPNGPRDAVGELHTGRGRLVADLSDLRLYNRVLSAEEIAAVQLGQ